MYYFIVSERQMVSLPLIKIYEFFPLDYSPGSREKKNIKIFSGGCQLARHLLAKGSPNQPKTLLLLNFFSKKPLTTADVATFFFFFLMNGDLRIGVSIVLLEQMSIRKRNPTSGLLSANLSSSSRTCSPCLLSHKV